MRSSCRPTSIPPTRSTPTSSRRRRSSSRSSSSSPSTRASRITSSTATTTRRSPSTGSRRRGATRKIAPDAPHALHMPSHIFTRVGAWQESVESNRASARSPPTRPSTSGTPTTTWSTRICSSARTARRAQVIEEALSNATHVDHFGAAYAYAAMPARIALERGDWKEAAKLPLDPAADAYPVEEVPAVRGDERLRARHRRGDERRRGRGAGEVKRLQRAA